MIDIHSYLKDPNDCQELELLLQDMAEYEIDYRVISTKRDLSNIENYKAIQELCEKNSDLIGCAFINPRRDDAIEAVKLALENPSFKMIEFDSYYNGYYPEKQDRLQEIFELIRGSEMVVKTFVGIGAYSIPQQWELWAKQFPTIPFVFLHMGCFDYGYACIDVVERNPNIYTETSNQYELQILRKAFKHLPIAKILFGTTYPLRLTSSGIKIFEMLELTAKEKEDIFMNNAKHILNL